MAYQPDDGSSDCVESYIPAPHAWYVLKQHIPEFELPEIRGILGDALIDLCTDTYSEVEMWAQIWRDVCHDQGGGANPPRAPLADSPVVKELLKAEVRLLLLSLKEKAAREGRDEEAILSCYSPSVVSYTMSSGQSGRALSAGSRLGPQETPSRPQSAKSLQELRSVSGLSASSGCEERIDAVKHKLNLKDIDKVVAHLRSVLTEDLEAMKREIQFLQECVEQEHQSPCDSLVQEPTVSELKEERKLIEKDLKLEEAVCHMWPSGRVSADYGLQAGYRPTGQTCGSAASSPPPLLVRPPRLLVEPSLPPATRPPSRVLDSAQQPRVSSFHHGDEHLRRCGEGSRPAVPDERARHPADPPAVGVLAGRPGPFLDPGLGSRAHSREAGSHTQEEREQAPSLLGCRPSRSHFPTSVVEPRPPVQRQTRGEAAAIAPPVSILTPAPPAIQKPATRGQSVTRRLRLPQGGLVSST